ncbi:CRISPR-associated ring nuclease Csm6 [Thauera aromatica]|uniref:CRISPR-associated ring nuclease Csm6 n=1 Tax=Thauera aromatica TaxID=59405 RepID=UPI001FFC3DB2|nr:CRISPR-associated ring nuclease Csm6 [Thauera aromatica]MCK2088278.1 CRISPR-associated ring nuclease Csm6 [Thauera aromatica]
MENLPPAGYARRILLAVTGLSPQIVTETLYALAVDAKPAFVPTEIHLITTAEGAERARLALLSDKLGWFHRLRHDYALPEITFDAHHIHILHDAAGQPLADIRSPADNLACADFITEKVRTFTAAPDTALHVSIAGGRKTMGFFLGYALSLFGRAQDRLSHVLVSQPFESSWSFFYPTPYEHIIETADKRLADARDARLSLAEIPFVSLRHGLPTALLDGSAGFEAAVDAARATLGPARLELDLPARTVTAAGQTFRLPPAELALLAVFARRARENEPALSAPHKEVPDAAWAERYLHELHAIVGPMGDSASAEHALRDGMDGSYFSSRLSKLRRTLKRELGPAAGPYLIEDGGGRPHRYRLALAPDAVRMVGPGRLASLR